MRRTEVFLQDGKTFTVELMEGAPVSELSRDSVQNIHVGATGIMCLLALMAALQRLESLGYGIALSFAIFCVIGLMIGRTLARPLGDLYRQFHYREKFLLFIIHVAVLFVPWFAGLRDWAFGFALLLLVLCFQGIDVIFYGRIYAASAFLVLLSCIGKDPPPAYLLAGWLLFLLLSIRFGHIYFRLLQHGDARQGVETRETITRALVIAVLPACVCLLLGLFFDGRLIRRDIVIQPGIIHQDGNTVFLSVGRMIFQAFFLVLLITVGLALLHWLDKYLIKRKRSAAPEVDVAQAGMRRYTVEPLDDPPLVEAPASGTRERILRTFRDLSAALAGLGLSRKEQETAADYFRRLSGKAEESDEVLVFEKACYGEEEPNEAEADLFEKARRRVELMAKNRAGAEAVPSEHSE